MPGDFSTLLNRSEPILRMSGRVDWYEFSESLRPLPNLSRRDYPKSSHTTWEKSLGVPPEFEFPQCPGCAICLSLIPDEPPENLVTDEELAVGLRLVAQELVGQLGGNNGETRATGEGAA